MKFRAIVTLIAINELGEQVSEVTHVDTEDGRGNPRFHHAAAAKAVGAAGYTALKGLSTTLKLPEEN